jgi:erythronate-4-phosphate dehydrogenase
VMLKVLADQNIPFAKEAFSEIGQVKLISGREITNESLKSTDILIVRSITRVVEVLLRNTSVKFVGTATIGSDHIDTKYLQQKNIGFANAPGCNADSVREYIFTGLLSIAVEENFRLSEKSIGIIGYGNIGSRVAQTAKIFGMRTLINDPPLQRKSGDPFFVPYEEALKADIITYHVPLNMRGMDQTYHMLSEMQLKEFDNNKIILNSSRGGVVSNNDLKNFLTRNKNKVILDVWEKEPQIDIELLNLVHTGTPHIAGYSLEGKVNGTVMIFDSLCKFLNLNKKWKPVLPEIQNSVLEFPDSGSLEKSLYLLFSEIYKIKADDTRLRKSIANEGSDGGRYFDELRKNYPVRREFSNYTVRIKKELKKEIEILTALRFKLRTY